MGLWFGLRLSFSISKEIRDKSGRVLKTQSTCSDGILAVFGLMANKMQNAATVSCAHSGRRLETDLIRGWRAEAALTPGYSLLPFQGNAQLRNATLA